MNRFMQLAAVMGGLMMGGTTFAMAADHEVLMLNRGPGNQTMHFEPAFLKVEPGDTVTFIPTDPGHNAESLLGMIPDGASTWKGKLNEAVTVTFDVPGLYAYKCEPHFAMGMVGLIQVGNNVDNLDAMLDARLPPRAQSRMFELFAKTSLGAAN